jgi:hypothetical protein
MKKCAATACLVLMLVNGTVYYLYFFIQQIAIKSEKHHQLLNMPFSQLDKLEISVWEFEEAQVEENEIQIGGRMFDVARVIRVNNRQLIVYGVYDSAEDELIAFLRCLTANEKQGCAPAFVLSSLYLCFDLPPSDELKAASAFDLTIISSPYFYPDNSVSLKMDLPPPRSSHII